MDDVPSLPFRESKSVDSPRDGQQCQRDSGRLCELSGLAPYQCQDKVTDVEEIEERLLHGEMERSVGVMVELLLQQRQLGQIVRP